MEKLNRDGQIIICRGSIIIRRVIMSFEFGKRAFLLDWYWTLPKSGGSCSVQAVSSEEKQKVLHSSPGPESTCNVLRPG
jgi:hypothetical protein